MRKSFHAVSIALLALAPAAAKAQDIPGMARPPIVIQQVRRLPYRQNLVSTDPLGVVFQWYNAELEHALSPEISLAAHASYVKPIDVAYTSADIIARYYPNAQGLRGFDIGGTVGFAHLSSPDFAYAQCLGCGPDYNQSANAFTLGIQGDYSWILGPSQHFGVELGVGAKRFFYNSKNTNSNFSVALPTARASIGYAW